jgi:hypothetical protein
MSCDYLLSFDVTLIHVADPHQLPVISSMRIRNLFHFDVDPDPTYQFDAYPDPTSHFDADLAPFFVKVMQICNQRSLQTLHWSILRLYLTPPF